MAANEWRIFTVAQADGVVGVIEPLLTKMTTAAGRLVAAKGRHDELTEAMRANGHGGESLRLQAEIEALVGELHEVVGAIEDIGVEVKGFEQGIVDFPARHEGRFVMLCYRPGEGRIRFWHEVDDGFAGRQSIDALDEETLGGPVQP